MSDEAFESVSKDSLPRTQHGRGRSRSPLTDAVLATALNGEVVRVTLNGRAGPVIAACLSKTLKHSGLKLRMRATKDDPSVAYFWAEKKETGR